MNAQLEEGVLDLRQYLLMLLAHKHLLLAGLMLGVALGGAVIWVSKPYYRADVLLQVEDSGAGMSGLDDLSNLMDSSTATEAEIEILTSRSVLGEVVKAYHLDTVQHPRYFPVFGWKLSSRFAADAAPDELAKPLLNLRHYAWGGERIQLDTLKVPRALLNHHLYLEVLDGQRFRLLDKELPLLEGVVGEKQVAHGITIKVTELHGQPGTQFEVYRLQWSTALKIMKEAVTAAETGKKSGILRLSMTGTDPDSVVAKLNAVARAYVRQNVARHAEEAENSLRFIQQQLPQVKVKLDKAEGQLNAYQADKGSANLKLETQTLLNRIVAVETELTTLDMQRSEVEKNFTAQHPALRALQDKQNTLHRQLDRMNAEVRTLPKQEQDILTMNREVELNAQLYTYLLNKSQELSVVRASTVGNVRILDTAILPDQAVKPNKPMIVLLAAMGGLGLMLVWVFVREAWRSGVEGADAVSALLGLTVYATIPFSRAQRRLSRARSSSLLCVQEPNDLAVESLKSLRTGLYFGLKNNSLRSIMMTGPAPQVGKTFVSTNLAHELAESGMKVLLVDADMRRGTIHRHLGLDSEPGLSDYLAGQVGLDASVQRLPVTPAMEDAGGYLCVLPRGKVPPNPSELLMRPRLEALLRQETAAYDMLLLDTAPVLAVTDATLLGPHVNSCFVVLYDARHQAAELRQCVKGLQNNGTTVTGVILNGSEPNAGYYGYRGSYRYSYKSERG